MIVSALAATCLLVQAPAETRVTAVSMFKNGYAMVLREASVSANGDVLIKDLPQASLGTFWLAASDGIQIQQAVVTSEERTEEGTAGSFEEILAANIGREIRLGTKNGDANMGEQTVGTLVSAAGNIVLIKKAEGQIAIPKTSITSIASSGGELLYKTSRKTTERVLRVRTRGSSGKITMLGLERGITWAPAYAVDISDPKTLTLVGKATILNDLAPLQNIEVKLITGFPNVPWTAISEPLLSGQSVDQFTQFLASVGVPTQGFAGRRDVMSQIAGNVPGAFADSFVPNTTPGTQAEDLFFYRLPGVTMKKGDRGYFILFQSKAPYEHLYTLDIGDTVTNNVEYRPTPEPSTPEVWHVIKFTNTAGQPLTTGPSTVFKDGEIMGQDTIPYTSPGAEVSHKLSKALDIAPEATEEETERQRNALQHPPGTSVYYDLVTVKGTLMIQNRKNQAVKMRVTKELTGEILSADNNPKIVKTVKGLRELNPRQRLTWDLNLAAGAKTTLTYTYKLYVR
ncbi:MAG TPA: hypothetical protein VEX38_00920 [Fimbriimonadaceae bacterium]|nr:hypothetical protein [Fimbriimonadaceae bacterium]